jgi:hypothetical protein
MTDYEDVNGNEPTIVAPGAVANPNIDREDSDFDIRHSFTAGVTYDLPSPESNKIARAALGGWSLEAVSVHLTRSLQSRIYFRVFQG